MLLLYPREILILDLELSQTVGVVAIERSGVPFIQVISVHIEINYNACADGLIFKVWISTAHGSFSNWFWMWKGDILCSYEWRATLAWVLTFQLVWARQKKGKFHCLPQQHFTFPQSEPSAVSPSLSLNLSTMSFFSDGSPRIQFPLPWMIKLPTFPTSYSHTLLQH